MTLIRKLRVLDKSQAVDVVHTLVWLIFAGGLATQDGPSFVIASGLCVALAALGVYRDECLRPRELPTEQIERRLAEIESELTAVKINQGIRTLS